VKYHAFLSYNHRADGELAPGLQRAIQRLSRPWYSPRPSLRIFRDGTDLPVSSALERAVLDALAQCEWLILMANPTSAKSTWVAKEMGWWLLNRSAERVLIVKSGGTILWDPARQDFDWAVSDALPSCLRGHLNTEPLYADLSGTAALAKPDARGSAVRDASIRIAARLLGRTPAEVEGDDLSQLRRNKAWAAGAGLVIAAAAATATYQWHVADKRADALHIELVQSRVKELAAQSDAAGRAGLDELSAVLATHALATDLSSRAARMQMIVAMSRLRALFSLRGHQAGLTSVVFSPDQRRILTAGEDGTARVWEVATGRQQLLLAGHDKAVQHAVFSPDGNRILTAGIDGTARLWDAHTGEQLHSLGGHASRVGDVVFSPNGEEAITLANDQTVRRWRLVDGLELAKLQLPAVPTEARYAQDGRTVLLACADPIARRWRVARDRPDELPRHVGRIAGVRFASEGRVLVWSEDGVARLWDGQGETLLREFRSDKASMVDGDMSADGRQLSAVVPGMAVNTWSLDTGKVTATMVGSAAGLTAVRFGARSDVVAATTKDDRTLVWSVDQGRLLARLTGHRDRLTDVAVGGAEAPLVATASADQSARLWQVYSAPLLHQQLSPNDHYARLLRLSDAHASIAATTVRGDLFVWRNGDAGQPPARHVLAMGSQSVYVAPDGLHLIHVGPDSVGRLLNADGTATAVHIAGIDGGGELAIFSGDGHRLATLHDGIVRTWSVDGGPALAEIDSGRLKVQHAVLDFAGHRLLTCDADNQPAQLWDVDHRRRIAQLDGASSPCIPFFSADGKQIMTVDEDGGTHWWSATTGASIFSARAHRGPVKGGAFSADGNLALSYGLDRTIRVWNVAQRHALAVLTGHTATIMSAEFNADGTQVLSASEDGSARVWDTVTGKELWLLTSDMAALVEAKFTPDGSRVLTLGRDGTLRTWDTAMLTMPTSQLLALARARIQALDVRLSVEECQRYFSASLGDHPQECGRRAE